MENRIEELEDILCEIVQMFESYDGKRKLAHGVTMAPILRAKRALHVSGSRHDPRQIELPL